MPRRRNKDLDVIGLAGPLAGLIVLATMFSPQARQAIVGLGFVAVCIMGLMVITFLALVAYRHFNRSIESETIERNIDWGTQRLAAVVSERQPQTVANLIGQLRSVDWYQFEKLVAHVYRKCGYAVTSRGGANPDGGIDLILEKDGQRTAVQCKQWKTWNVGVKAVREFLGALKDSGIDAGIFITLQGYTGDAKLLAEKHRIEMLNESGLVDLLETINASSDPETLAILNDERKFCPKCDCEMVLRTAKKGNNIGQTFWGCSEYPRCRSTLRA